jgi:hypothetical protein
MNRTPDEQAKNQGGHMKNRVLAAFVFLILLGHASAQKTAGLNRLDEKLARHLETKMPDWKHERGEPIAGSDDSVLIEFWSFSNRKMKVSILLHDSVEQAQQVIENHARYSFNKETLTGLGDEAYASGYGSSLVAFRRGKFTVYVSTTADVDADLDAGYLTQEQRFEREKSEMKRLSTEFAKHVVDAIDAP